MIKCFSPEHWAGTDVQGDGMIKIASRGLGAGDKAAAKKFASEELLHWLSKLATHPDCVYVHKLAMSGSRRFGPNRWGDGFREEVLSRDVPTFETHAKAFRHHQSKDAPFFGRPKIAKLRPETGIVELVTEYYGSDKVAEANGGRIADLEIQSLAKRGHIPVSMGSHVPYDVCVICGHRAKTRAEHCLSIKEGGCCPLYGCRNGILKLAEDGRQQFVDNPFNLFFDISYVGTGADPIANGVALPLGMLAGEKRAEFSDKVAALLEAETRHFDETWTPQRRRALQILHSWADVEQKVGMHPEDELTLGVIFAEAVQGSRGLHSNSTAVRQQTLDKLAMAGVFPRFEQYAKEAGLQDHEIKYSSTFVPDSYTRIVRANLVPHVLQGIHGQNSEHNFFESIKEAAIDKESLKAAIQRGLLAQAENRQVSRVKTAQLEKAIPAIVVRYATDKLAWAANTKQGLWSLMAIPAREFFEEI